VHPATPCLVVSGVFPYPLTYCLMQVTPLLRTGIDIVLVGTNTGSWGNRGADQRLNRHLLHVFKHPNHHRYRAMRDKSNVKEDTP
jgi:hypothetical protein